jgi:hypothetical protein
MSDNTDSDDEDEYEEAGEIVTDDGEFMLTLDGEREDNE